MNAKYYDLNVWSQAPDEVCLTAYEWEDCPSGGIQMNTEKFRTIRFIGLDKLTEIEFLTQDLWLNSYPLTDFDEWRDLEEVYNNNAPRAIKDFIEGLPIYELPTNLTKENA